MSSTVDPQVQLHIDLGIGDAVAPVTRTTALTFGDGNLSWQVYPPETILAEKLHALVTIGSRNSRAKDVFDVDLLLPQTTRDALDSALKATFASRGDPLPRSVAECLEALGRDQLRLAWAVAVRSAKDTRSFDDVMNQIIIKIKDWGL